MRHSVRRWMLGLMMLFTLAAFCKPAEAQYRRGRHHHRHHPRHHRHPHRGYRR